jgi:hypothetical protein
MFDLEKRIGEWRASMMTSLPSDSDALDELESHLREQLHRLALEGMNAEAAWQLALERLGPSRQLGAEFAKNAAAEPSAWAAVALLLCFCVCIPLALAAVGNQRIAADGLLAFHVLTVTLGYTYIILFGAVAIGSFAVQAIRGLKPRTAARLHWAGRWLICAALLLNATGFGAGAIWAERSWGRFWNWDVLEIGGLAVVGWSLVALWLLSRKGQSAGTGGIVIGVIGNIVVWCAWFGSAWHHYGSWNPLGFVLIVVVAAHLVLLTYVAATTRHAAPAKS